MDRCDIIGANRAPLFEAALRKCGVSMNLLSWDILPKMPEEVLDRSLAGKAVTMAEWKVRTYLKQSASGKYIIGFHTVGVIDGGEVPDPITREDLLKSYLDALEKSLEYRVGIALAYRGKDGSAFGKTAQCRSQSLSLRRLDEEAVRRLVASMPATDIPRAGLGYRPFTDPYASLLVDDLAKEKEIFTNLMEASIRAMFPEVNR